MERKNRYRIVRTKDDMFEIQDSDAGWQSIKSRSTRAIPIGGGYGMYEYIPLQFYSASGAEYWLKKNRSPEYEVIKEVVL